jgi:hypothetical protein
MANFSIPAPVESEKSSFLHDRSNRPAAPTASRIDLARRWASFAAGAVLAVGATALLFSVRDSWENHREWLVTLIPFLVIAGIALAHLTARKQVIALVPGGTFLFLALIFAGADIIADNDSGASDTTRDVLSILGGISLGIATLCFVVALAWVEIRKPTKAPAPEL